MTHLERTCWQTLVAGVSMTKLAAMSTKFDQKWHNSTPSEAFWALFSSPSIKPPKKSASDGGRFLTFLLTELVAVKFRDEVVVKSLARLPECMGGRCTRIARDTGRTSLCILVVVEQVQVQAGKWTKFARGNFDKKGNYRENAYPPPFPPTTMASNTTDSGLNSLAADLAGTDLSNLYRVIDRDKWALFAEIGSQRLTLISQRIESSVHGLNLTVPEDAKKLIKPWDQREDNAVYVDSNVDDQVWYSSHIDYSGYWL